MDSTEQARVDDAADDYEPSSGVLHGVGGVLLLVLGGLSWVNAAPGGDQDLARACGLALLGAGVYLIIAGAVARGIQMARR